MQIPAFRGLTKRRKYDTLICAKMKYADVAQSVEQLIRNQQVAGSSPAISSMSSVQKGFYIRLLYHEHSTFL